MAKTKWLKHVPKDTGWYWAEYRDGKDKRICPTLVYWIDEKRYLVRTGLGSVFTSNNPKALETSKVRFGSKLEEPK